MLIKSKSAVLFLCKASEIQHVVVVQTQCEANRPQIVMSRLMTKLLTITLPVLSAHSIITSAARTVKSMKMPL